tara:strand:+ start:137 stop:469 length:333 start_codon:yes stop_codon:yes gene_type:complete
MAEAVKTIIKITSSSEERSGRTKEIFLRRTFKPKTARTNGKSAAAGKCATGVVDDLPIYVEWVIQRHTSMESTRPITTARLVTTDSCSPKPDRGIPCDGGSDRGNGDGVI